MQLVDRHKLIWKLQMPQESNPVCWDAQLVLCQFFFLWERMTMYVNFL